LYIAAKARAVIELSRPHNVAITFLGVALGALVIEPGALYRPAQLLLASLPALLVAAGGYIVNDYYDLEIDRRSKPWRPLVRGDISPREALALSILLIMVGVSISLAIYGVLIGSFVALNAILTYTYSWRLKKAGLAGNTVVSILSANSILYGGLVYMRGERGWWESLSMLLIPWAFAAIMSLSREIVKGVEDIEGDRAYGVKTIAAVRGYRYASALASVLLAILLAVVAIPFLLKHSVLYIVLAVVSTSAFLASSIWIAASTDTGVAIRRAAISRSVSKVSLLLGTLAFLAWVLS